MSASASRSISSSRSTASIPPTIGPERKRNNAVDHWSRDRRRRQCRIRHTRPAPHLDPTNWVPPHGSHPTTLPRPTSLPKLGAARRPVPARSGPEMRGGLPLLCRPTPLARARGDTPVSDIACERSPLARARGGTIQSRRFVGFKRMPYVRVGRASKLHQRAVHQHRFGVRARKCDTT